MKDSSTGPASSHVMTASGLVDARVSAGALSSSKGVSDTKTFLKETAPPT